LIDVVDTLPEEGQYEYFKIQLLNIYQQHPEPATVKELQGFLGVINFYEGRDRRVDTVLRVATAEG
jgi:hypothetical protein